MRKFVLGAASALAFMATPAMASTVVVASCDSVTDGDTAGCLFSGNINENPDPTNVNSYKNAEAAYNAFANPDITLNWLTATDDTDGSDGSVFADFGSITVNPGGLTGTFDLSGYNIEYYAVKYGGKDGPQFTLYEYLGTDGTGTWQTNGKNEMSHIAFFGTPGVVPEPATWAMMIAGFGLVGGAMRRRQTRPAIVTA
jgi:opacity protein-like surface antigen